MALTQAQAEAHIGQALSANQFTYLEFLRKGTIKGTQKVLVGAAWFEAQIGVRLEKIEGGLKFSMTTADHDQDFENYVLSQQVNLAGDKAIFSVAAADRRSSPNAPSREDIVDADDLKEWDTQLTAKGIPLGAWMNSDAMTALRASAAYTKVGS